MVPPAPSWPATTPSPPPLPSLSTSTPALPSLRVQPSLSPSTTSSTRTTPSFHFPSALRPTTTVLSLRAWSNTLQPSHQSSIRPTPLRMSTYHRNPLQFMSPLQLISHIIARCTCQQAAVSVGPCPLKSPPLGSVTWPTSTEQSNRSTRVLLSAAVRLKSPSSTITTCPSAATSLYLSLSRPPATWAPTQALSSRHRWQEMCTSNRPC